jgi:uncharacterized surface anchored protein
MTMQDPTKGAGRRLLRVAVIALVVIAVGPVGSALALSPPRIESPQAGQVVNTGTPTFSGFAEEVNDEVSVAIYEGTTAGGRLVEEPLETPEAPAGNKWSVMQLTPLPDGTYTAVATQFTGPTGTTELSSSPVTFTIDTAPSGPPTVTADPASSITQTTATLNATVASNGGEVTGCEFRYGPTSAYGTSAPCTPPSGAGGPVSASITGLSPSTTYHFTIVAANGTGTSVGSDLTFATAPIALPPAAPSGPPVPTASFSWFPSVPLVGQSVSLISTSTDSTSAITAFAWAPTGGVFHAGGPLLTTSFSTPGNHVVRLLVTDANGLSSVATQTIQVISAPLILMQPFPIVRFAGSENSSGVHLRLLTVQAPVGARVTVSCKGHGCPAKSQGQIALSRKKNAGTVVVEFRRFERSLRAGVVLEIRVSKAGEIGKYTRFVVRHGKLPERFDMCLDAAGVSPLVCPSS